MKVTISFPLLLLLGITDKTPHENEFPDHGETENHNQIR